MKSCTKSGTYMVKNESYISREKLVRRAKYTCLLRGHARCHKLVFTRPNVIGTLTMSDTFKRKEYTAEFKNYFAIR